MRSIITRPPWRFLDANVQNATIASSGNSVFPITSNRSYMVSAVTGGNDFSVFLPSAATSGMRWNGIWHVPMEFDSGSATTVKIVNNHTSNVTLSLVELE